MCLIRDDGELKIKNNAQHHSPRPIHNNWHYFRPTLVFAGHYLSGENYPALSLLLEMYIFFKKNIFVDF
jgi:hypothetical protein